MKGELASVPGSTDCQSVIYAQWKHLFPSGLASLVLLSCRDPACAGELFTFEK